MRLESATQATRLGSYEVLEKFARGGMAELFLARAVGPEGFEKLVVLKKILPEFAENPRFVRLFLDEAKLAASLDHPNIAQVYDMGVVDGNYFFTMEYVHGRDLRTVMKRAVQLGTALPIGHAVQVCCSVAAALEYAHERRGPDGHFLGVVHRDVSPSNVIISYDGAIKLLDFGVAKAATSSVKTRTGALKGKVSYMSPEQARGADLDRRSDVFSLGICLWEMVTGRRLFKGKNDLATIHGIINDPIPSVADHIDSCPPQLEAIISKALARDIAERYQTARELQRDLEEFATEHRIKLSTLAISDFMNGVFADEIGAWRDAQSAGVTLSEHIIASEVIAAPASESSLGEDDVDLEDMPTTSVAEVSKLIREFEILHGIKPGSPPVREVSRPPDTLASEPGSRPVAVAASGPATGELESRKSSRAWLMGAVAIAAVIAAGVWVIVREAPSESAASETTEEPERAREEPGATAVATEPVDAAPEADAAVAAGREDVPAVDAAPAPSPIALESKARPPPDKKRKHRRPKRRPKAKKKKKKKRFDPDAPLPPG